MMKYAEAMKVVCWKHVPKNWHFAQTNVCRQICLEIGFVLDYVQERGVVIIFHTLVKCGASLYVDFHVKNSCIRDNNEWGMCYLLICDLTSVRCKEAVAWVVQGNGRVSEACLSVQGAVVVVEASVGAAHCPAPPLATVLATDAYRLPFLVQLALAETPARRTIASISVHFCK